MVLNTYSKVWVTGDTKGPGKIGKNTGAGTMDAAFAWDDVAYKADKAKVNLLTMYTRSNNNPNGNNSYMQGGFAIATLTAKGVVAGPEVNLPNLNGERTWMRPIGGFLPGNRVLLMAATEDNGINNNPQPAAFVADATTGQILGIPNNTRGANNLNKPTNLIRNALANGVQVQNPNDQRGPHTIQRVSDDTFVVGMQYNNQAQEAYSITVAPDNRIKINWLKRYSNNAQHCRPQVAIAPGASTGYISSVEANNQPADIGWRLTEFNVATGQAINSKIVVRSDPKNNKYISEPVLSLLGDKIAVTYGNAARATKGENGQGHAGGAVVHSAVLVDKSTLQAVGTPLFGVGTYARHTSSFVTSYGPKGEPSLAVISGSSTGTGGGFIQMFPIKTDGTLGNKDAAKVYPVSPFSDVASVQAMGKRNPNNQARGFINGLGDVPNPGFTTDAATAAGNFMPEVKSFSFSTVTGYSGADAKNLGIKNSIWLSLVPASWQEGITTVPGKPTDVPGTNPDGTGPSPKSTSPGTDPSGDATSTEDEDVVPDGDDKATKPKTKERKFNDAQGDGCSVSHHSSSSSFGLIGLAVAGVLVGLRKRSRKDQEA
ncbi:MAG: hypothetical protein KIT84_29295 [Labilithrix sp.]|nr:hypothetical protein [Labilithrix sp.]MCW5815158.1 hypothetical protein [Labilithrix sp.]